MPSPFAHPTRRLLAGLLLASCLRASAPDAAPLQAQVLTVDAGLVNPLGFHQASPTFSWKLPPEVRRQTAYRLELRTGKQLWDSGWVESDQNTFVPYRGPALASRQKLEWRVCYRDETGRASAWSAPASLELGLLCASDWLAQWIRPAGANAGTEERVGYLRRHFSITKKVLQARLYVTARGLFEMQLNGTRIGKDYFANGFTAYDKRLDTLTYDLTPSLRQGENTLGALLASGWYSGRYPFDTRKTGPYGHHSSLIAQLEIRYEDGSSETLVSDEKWEGSFNGPLRSSSIYDGEVYDAGRQPADWAPVLVEKDLGVAELSPKPFAPVREMATRSAVSITQPTPGHHVFDLGQNMVGWARLRVPGEKGRTLTLRFAEMLNADGTLYTEAYRSAKSTDTYTPAATGLVEWEPRFTFHGFRYVEISGLPDGAVPQKDWVTGVVLHSEFPITGRFSSSHEKLNQLQDNITWGWRGNALDIPTDCPQRDERAGWTGDAQVFCATALFNTGSHAFWKTWLRSLRDEQDADGGIPNFVPTAKSGWRSNSPGWIDAATIIPWELYVRTGDLSVLAENFGMMQKLLGLYRAQSVNGLTPKMGGFGDWLQPYQTTPVIPGDGMSNRYGDTPRPLLGVAYYARSAQILADTARVLGHLEDSKRYEAEAAAVRAAFVKEYFDGNGKSRVTPETQTTYVLAIAFNLLPPELKSKAGEHLARLVREAGTHLRTGFLGTAHLAQALDQSGQSSLAYELLFQESYPSWFYPINQGATTMWERWNSYTRETGFGDVEMNSFNHYAYGAVGQWLYERVAGLCPDPAYPGYKHFFIRPLLGKQLDSARAEYETPHGKAVSAWQRRDGNCSLDVVIPPNTTATVEFPGDRKPELLGPGSYHFELKGNGLSTGSH